MKINRKTLFISLAMIFVFALFYAPRILAQITFPRITTACEMKNGSIYGVSDGFSPLAECPKGSRTVLIIGDQGPKGDTGMTGPQGSQGIQGEIGPKGDTGEQGVKGQDGVSGYEKVFGTRNGPSTGQWKGTTASCPTGKKVVGGGYNISGNIIEIFVFDNQPFNETTWKVAGFNKNNPSLEWSIQSYAICVNAL